MTPQKRTNILITSAGRRVELVQAFLAERDRLASLSKVFASDIRPSLSSACHVADRSFASPQADSVDFAKFIIENARANNIGLIVPTIDTELAVLAGMAAELAAEGVTVLVPSLEFVQNCRDKRLTSHLFAKINVRYPQILDPNALSFPAFAKPYDGSSSIGAKLLSKASDLTQSDFNNARMMYMEYIGPPFVEYTIDAYFNRHSQLCSVVPRKRIETRAGEVSKGITRRNAIHAWLCKTLSAWSDVKGCITLQLFFNETSEEMVGLEINPRFGGGFPLSYAAGANFPGWAISEYILNQDIAFSDTWEDNLLMLRYDAKVLVHDADY